MIVMMCGKGGCGKSTVTALLANTFAKSGKKVIVIDMDESNYGLYRQLGLELPKDFTHYFGFKKGIFQVQDNLKEGEKVFPEVWSYDTLPEEFVSSDGNVKLMAVGKIHHAGEGCACPMGSVAKELLDNLSLEKDEIVLVDAEAGVEHFGRGIDAKADKILMVVDPSYESVSLAKKIKSMCEDIHKPFGIILNKVTKEQESIILKSFAGEYSVAGIIGLNDEIMTKGLLGEKLDFVPGGVSQVMDYLLS
ncbi:MAG: P-loop NTPase [Eubacteriales bacterium]|nr:P-loop NTPase [Eubacteriales bacterium]